MKKYRGALCLMSLLVIFLLVGFCLVPPGLAAVPDDPAGLSASSQSSSSIRLTWNAVSDADGYRIYRCTLAGGIYNQIAVVDAYPCYYTDTGLSSNTEYYYKIKAYNGSGNSGYSNITSATTNEDQVPSAPVSLTAYSLIDGSIRLSWSYSSSTSITGFEIERKRGSGNYSVITNTGPSSRSYTDDSVISGVTYTYRIRAYNSQGYSAYSNTTTSSSDSGSNIELYKATNLKARTTSDDYVYLSWQDNSYNESSYHIERRYSGGSWTEIGTTGSNCTSYTDTNIYTNQTYWYRIRAYGGGSYSAYSDEVSVDVYCLTPEPPTNLRVTSNSDTSVTLRWSDNSSDEFGFKIERRRSGGSYSQIATVGANVTTYEDRDLQAGVSYEYRVKAYNGYGDSEYSNKDSETTTSGSSFDLETPTGFKAEAVGTTAVRLTWNDNSRYESGFKIERKKENGSFSQIDRVSYNTTSYSDTGLEPNTRYYYRIRAYNLFGNSSYSSEISVTTSNSVTNSSGKKVARYYLGVKVYFVNDQAQNLDSVPMVSEGRAMLPARFIAAPIGANITWDAKERKTTITLDGKTVEIWAGQNAARVNGQYGLIDTTNPKVKAVIVPPGRVMLPIRFISENLGCQVEWNQSLNEIRVTYPK